MKPTKSQLQLLKFYAKYETKPLTVFGIVRSFWLAWMLLALAAVLSYSYVTAGWSVAGWLLLGGCAGAFLRDVGRIISFFGTWPVMREIINWKRLTELSQDHEEDAV
jgi:hypothetical protein